MTNWMKLNTVGGSKSDSGLITCKRIPEYSVFVENEQSNWEVLPRDPLDERPMRAVGLAVVGNGVVQGLANHVDGLATCRDGCVVMSRVDGPG